MQENFILLRETINKLIASEKTLQDDVISVYIYGSFATGEVTASSDIDCYFVLEKTNSEVLDKIKILKKEVEKLLGREFFINILNLSDFARENFINNRFIHRERPYYFLFELKYNFLLFYGRDLNLEINYPEFMVDKVKEECIRLMKNFQYINNKLIVNSETNLYSKDAAYKNILFAAKIFQIFNEYRFNNYQESISLISSRLKSVVPSVAYNLIKKKGDTSLPREVTAADSIIFYDLAVSDMVNKASVSDKITGCLKHGDYLGYFSIKSDILKNNKPVQVIFFLNGLPRPAQIKELSEYFINDDFLFINVYYPGYWEAPGKMDFNQLSEALINFAIEVKRGELADILSGEKYTFKVDNIYLIGSSFGGTIALNSQSEIFSKIVAVSPLLDFSNHKSTIDNLYKSLVFFHEVVRAIEMPSLLEEFAKLDPKNKFLAISSEKILLIADKSDNQINFDSIKKYALENEIILIESNQGTHGYKIIKQDNIRSQLFNFIKK